MSDLDDLRIDSPCPKRWTELDGDEAKRFCGECRLHVVNLSAMTEREAQRKLAQRTKGERLCVRYTTTPSGEFVTREAMGWRPRLVTWALGVFASLGLAACAEEEPATPPEAAPDEGCAVEGKSHDELSQEELEALLEFMGYISDC